MLSIGKHSDGLLCGEAYRKFSDEIDQSYYGGYGNFLKHEFVDSNETLNQIGEDAFISQMKNQIAKILNCKRGIDTKTTMVRK